MFFRVTALGRRPTQRTSAFIAAAVTALALATLAPVSAAAESRVVASSGDGAPTDRDGDGIVERPDAVAAAATAQAMDEPVEDLSRRTETSKTLANPDGTSTLESAAGIQRVQREDGAWEDIDLDLAEQADGTFAPKVAASDVVIGGGGSKLAATINLDGDQALSVTWPETLPEPTIQGGVATYSLSETSDLLVIATKTGVAAHIRLNERPAEDDPALTMGLKTENLALDTTAKSELEVIDNNEKTVASTAPMKAWDAQLDEAGDPINVVPVKPTLETVSSDGDIARSELTLEPEAGFLKDPKTVYPVIIDPDISRVTPAGDTMVRKGVTDQRGADARLWVGRLPESTSTDQWLTYVAWDNTQLAGRTILAATAKLWQYKATSCNRQMNARALSSALLPGTVFTNRPSVISTYGSSTTDGPCGDDSGWVSINLKNMAQAWASGTPNHGVQLSVPPDYATNYNFTRRFCSANESAAVSYCNTASKNPVLSITYNSAPATPSDVSVEGANLTDGIHHSRSSTPTILAGLSDPEGTTVRAQIRVLQGATVKQTSNSAYVASGEVSTTQLATLPDGNYTVEVRSFDGHVTSTAARTINLEIDTKNRPPATPTMVTVEGSESVDPFIIDTSTPTVKATLTDPDEDDVTALVVVKQGATVVQTVESAEVASGEVATAQLASLTDGEYTVEVKSSDGQLASAAAAINLVVETEAPTPTITEDQWAYTSVTPALLFNSESDPDKMPTSSSPKSVTVVGVQGVPATGVGTVVLEVSASSPTGVSSVCAKSDASDETEPFLTTGPNAAKRSNTVVVEPSSSGSVTFAVVGEPVDLSVVVRGFFAELGEDDPAARFIPVEPLRALDSSVGEGVPQGKLGSTTTHVVDVAGLLEDVPPHATAVFATVRVSGATAVGHIRLGSAGTDLASLPPGPAYGTSGPTASGVVIPLGTTGANQGKAGLTLSAGEAHVSVDVHGYLSPEVETGGLFTSLPQKVIYDSRDDPRGPLAPGESRDVKIAGEADLPHGGVNSLVTTVSAVDWTADGSVGVTSGEKYGAETATVAFAGTYADPVRSTTIVGLLNSDTVAVKLDSLGEAHVVLTVQGWFDSPDPQPSLIMMAPDVQEIAGAPATGSESLTFTPPVSSAYTLTSVDSENVALSLDGNPLGNYQVAALDNRSQLVPATVTVNEGSMIASVTPSTSAAYPITVAMIVDTELDENTVAERLQGATPLPRELRTETAENRQETASLDPNWDNVNLNGTQIYVPEQPSDYHPGGVLLTVDDEVVRRVYQEYPETGQTGWVSNFFPGIPRFVNQSGQPVKEKFYYHDPELKSPLRQPWKKSWHDYCTGVDSEFKDTVAGGLFKMYSSFQAPCARHDLCIEFKLAPHRSYCDAKMIADMRKSCNGERTHLNYPAVIEWELHRQCTFRAYYYGVGIRHGTARASGGPGSWGHDGPSSYPTWNWFSW